MEVEGTTNAVIKVVTCDMFEFDLSQTELNQQKTPGAWRVSRGPPNVTYCVGNRLGFGCIRRRAAQQLAMLLKSTRRCCVHSTPF